jgi:hypothetical protein
MTKFMVLYRSPVSAMEQMSSGTPILTARPVAPRRAAYGRPRRQVGLRLSRNARIPSLASGSWLVAAMTSTA